MVRTDRSSRATAAARGDVSRNPKTKLIALTRELCHTLQTLQKSQRKVDRERELRDEVHTIATGMIRLAPGEEDRALTAAAERLGSVLGAMHLSLWGIFGDVSPPSRIYSWEPAGASSSIDPSVLVELLRPDDASVVSDTPFGADVVALVVPGTATAAGRCALVAARAAHQPWQEFERSQLGELVDLIQQVRVRLATEAQMVASFIDAPVAITIRRLDGRLVDCNRAFAGFLGVDDEAELFAMSEVELLASSEITEEMLDGLADGVVSSGLELPFAHADGHVVWGRRSTTRIPGIGGEALLLSHIEDVSAMRESYERNRRLAATDDLTGLANRRTMESALAERLNATETAAADLGLIVVDVNDFKAVNDTFGHAAGDAVLREVAQRLRLVSRHGDVVTRLGGDEFVIIADAPRSGFGDHLARVRNAVSRPVEMRGHWISVSAAVGGATAQPGDTAESLFQRADAAMYASKRDVNR